MTPRNEAYTQLVLANAIHLVAAVIEEVVGEEISTHVNGEEMYGNVLSDTIAVNLQGHLTKTVGI